jgi:YidC/Oxa1 family membrane protein insertase
MSDFRRNILWAILVFCLILLWDRWQAYNGRPATFFPGFTQQGNGTNLVTENKNTDRGVNNLSTDNAITGSVLNRPTLDPETLYEVETDVLKMRFSDRGARLVYVELLDYPDQKDPNKNVVLLDDRQGYLYINQTGLVGPDFPNHQSSMRLVSDQRDLTDGQDSLRLQFESKVLGGVKLTKTWVFERGTYDAKVTHEVQNLGQNVVNPDLYLRIYRDSNKAQGSNAPAFFDVGATFSGPAVYSQEGGFQKVPFSDLDNNDASYQKYSQSGYIAMVQHYFVSAWLLPDGIERENTIEKVGVNTYAFGMLTPLGQISPGASETTSSIFFVGPQIEKRLERIYPGFELVKDYGWFTILAKPLYWLLDQLHSILGNWGWAIVALVFLIKALLYWPNAKAYSSMAKMKSINPRIVEMRKRLKDEPRQMQQEMVRIYREEKVNPLGGCLPILIQIPIFIALYWVLLSSVEMRGAPWILWIKDLSLLDPYFILPLLMTVTTLLQTWLNPTPPDPTQAKLMWALPIVFSIMFFFFPAGLVLYWLTNNILTIAQQWVINRRLGVI